SPPLYLHPPSLHDALPILSIFRPISPPRASISRTTIPFAEPPMAGLHGIKANISRLMVASRVLHPIRADAKLASTPACPAPTTRSEEHTSELQSRFDLVCR